MQGCYLFHFSAPVSDRHTCQHYLGFGEDLEKRIAQQLAGRGANLTRVAIERGITLTLVRTWPGYSRTDERRLKNQKDGRALCPICKAARYAAQQASRTAKKEVH